jgi:hypothetical protein
MIKLPQDVIKVLHGMVNSYYDMVIHIFMNMVYTHFHEHGLKSPLLGISIHVHANSLHVHDKSPPVHGK